MADIIHPGSGVLYMKVGVHANEPLESIIERKRKEIEEVGFGMWGYGGSTCYPTTMVQPFAKMFEERGEVIHLCMEEMDSKHDAPQIAADEFSVDGNVWKNIPHGINALGSRFALIIKSLDTVDLELSLAQTQVAVGRSQGRPGHRYIIGQSDKACFEVLPPTQGIELLEETKKPITLTAELADPYAVFLRNRP